MKDSVNGASQAVRLLGLTALVLGLLVSDVRAQTPGSLESFYATVSNSRIVRVEAVETGVKVRVIDIDFHDDLCWQHVVRAYDVVLPGTSVAALAATPVCALAERRVNRAVERSREKFLRAKYDIPSGSPMNTVVAICGGQQRRFVFDYHEKPGVNGRVLKRLDPSVHALWTLGDRIAARVSKSAPDITAQETSGTALAADLVAGSYDAAYADMCWDEHGKRTRCSPGFWTQLLGDYTGPPENRGPLPVELVNRASWQFVHYVPAILPPIALSARVLGDVRLRLEVERGTGAVTQAAVMEGHALLNDAALSATRQWRFVPGTTPVEPFEVTLRFELRCPER